VKGVLFNVVEDVVDETLPEATWDLALDRACLAGVYTSLGDYPDDDLAAIVGAVCERTGLAPEQVLHHVGLHGYRHLVERQPDLVEGITDLGSLLHHLEDVIHPEVRKLHPEADPPSFEIRDVGPDRWEVDYRSKRQLCHLAEGLIAGAAVGFGTPCEIEQLRCVVDGADHCCLLVSVTR
jgi:predicted hydrocarbon binding protein